MDKAKTGSATITPTKLDETVQGRCDERKREGSEEGYRKSHASFSGGSSVRRRSGSSGEGDDRAKTSHPISESMKSPGRYLGIEQIECMVL